MCRCVRRRRRAVLTDEAPLNIVDSVYIAFNIDTGSLYNGIDLRQVSELGSRRPLGRLGGILAGRWGGPQGQAHVRECIFTTMLSRDFAAVMFNGCRG